MTFEPLYSLSGLVVGALVGITGVGGGSLMTPLLVLLFGVHPATAVGTDLLYAAITKTAGTAVHGMHGRVNWKIVGSLAAGSVPAALLMLWLMAGVDRKSIGVTEYHHHGARLASGHDRDHACFPQPDPRIRPPRHR